MIDSFGVWGAKKTGGQYRAKKYTLFQANRAAKIAPVNRVVTGRGSTCNQQCCYGVSTGSIGRYGDMMV